MITDIFGNKTLGELELGVRYRRFNYLGGYVEFTHCEADISSMEADWVKGELLRTDPLVSLPDYPHMEKVLAYRVELRQYDLSGVRPDTPSTEKGTLI